MSLRDLRARLARLDARVKAKDAPPWQEVVAAIGRGAARARARLTGEPVNEKEAKRDGELLERWRRAQGISPEVIAQEAEEARANLMRRE